MFNISKLPWFERLKLLRVGEKLTQVEISKKIGVSVKTYIRWEKGQNVPMLVYRESVGEVLEVDQSELFGSDPKRKEEAVNELR